MQIPFLKNVLTLIVLFFLGYYLVENVKGYVWLKDNFLKSNLKKIERFKDADRNQKYEAYFGFNYRFLTYINENTSDSAVILMPPDSVIFPADGKSDFSTKKKSQSVRNLTWSMYFTYPRELVYMEDYLSNPEAFNYTHVACVNGWGYEYLDYPVAPQQQTKYQILPKSAEDLRKMNQNQNQK